MRILFGIFLCMTLFGSVTGAWLPAGFILFVAVCIKWADLLLDDVASTLPTDPRSAKAEPDTLCMLDRYAAECMGIKADPRFPRQTSEPDLEI